MENTKLQFQANALEQKLSFESYDLTKTVRGKLNTWTQVVRLTKNDVMLEKEAKNCNPREWILKIGEIDSLKAPCE